MTPNCRAIARQLAEFKTVTMHLPQSNLIRRTLCPLTLCVFVLCCGGCRGIQGHATFDSHQAAPNVAHLGPRNFVGVNAGYCETNWTSLEPTDGWVETVQYGPIMSAPNSPLPASPDPTTPVPVVPVPVGPEPESSEPESSEPVSSEPVSIDGAKAQQTGLSPANDAPISDATAKSQGVAYVRSGKNMSTKSDSPYKEVRVDYLRSGHLFHKGALEANPGINHDQTAGKQLEQWRRRS